MSNAKVLTQTEVIEPSELLFEHNVRGWTTIQEDLFPAERGAVEQGKPIPVLEQANIDDDMKHPIILGDHLVVRLFIMSAHHRAMHMGAEVVRANLRRHFHILNGSRIIRSVLSRCIYCRRLKAKAYNPTITHLRLNTR